MFTEPMKAECEPDIFEPCEYCGLDPDECICEDLEDDLFHEDDDFPDDDFDDDWDDLEDDDEPY